MYNALLLYLSNEKVIYNASILVIYLKKVTYSTLYQIPDSTLKTTN